MDPVSYNTSPGGAGPSSYAPSHPLTCRYLPLPPPHQVPTAAVGTDAFQECMAVDLTRPCTKWSYQVQSVEEVRPAMHL